jgi:tRNA threonylcarbamoyladenosine biosynthesis protein TsaE
MSFLPPLASEGRLALTESELAEWGQQLGRHSTPPLVIALSGELGSGKTTLARAICEGYGVSEPVTSPTFAIVHTYEAPRSAVHHLDLYRLKGVEELQNIGWDEIVAANALVLVEWPERAGSQLPASHVPIELSHAAGDPQKRILYAGGHLGHQTGVR